jgi:hypothetical protein
MNKYEVYFWLVKVIDGTENLMQFDTAVRLVDAFKKLYKEETDLIHNLDTKLMVSHYNID